MSIQSNYSIVDVNRRSRAIQNYQPYKKSEPYDPPCQQSKIDEMIFDFVKNKIVRFPKSFYEEQFKFDSINEVYQDKKIVCLRAIKLIDNVERVLNILLIKSEMNYDSHVRTWSGKLNEYGAK